MNKKIGIIGAMRVEIETLKQNLEACRTETVGGMEFHTGKLSGVDAVLAVCGVGKVFAAMCAQTMILHFGVDAILNTGVAGTLTDALSVGDVAVAVDVVQHDMDTSPLGDPIGLISGLNMVKMPSDPELVNAVCAAIEATNGNYRTGTIASGDVFVASEPKKQYIRDTFGAIACEMEGASIGQVCTVNRIPFAVIRAISDGGNEDAHMDYPTFVQMAAANSAAVVQRVLQSMHE